MDLRVLEDFLTLAECGSFSRAAERRNCVQSAFSRRIQGLESWVGAVLIDRRSNPLQLTAAGEAFIHVAEDVLRRVKHGRQEIASVAAKKPTAVSFAVTHTLSLNFFAGWISRIEEKTGPLPLRLLTVDGRKCREAVSGGDCHFMLCHFSPQMVADFQGSRMQAISLSSDRLIPVCAAVANSQLANIPGRPDAPVPYLTYADGSFMGRAIALFLQTTGRSVYLQSRLETSLAESLKAMILEGRGVGWLPESIVSKELDSGELVRAGMREWDIDVQVCIFRPITRLPERSEKLWELIRRDAPAIVEFA